MYLGRRKARIWFLPSRSTTALKTSAAKLCEKLRPLVRKTPPYAKRIAHWGIWVEPKVLAEIEHRAKSADPFFKGLEEL